MKALFLASTVVFFAAKLASAGGGAGFAVVGSRQRQPPRSNLKCWQCAVRKGALDFPNNECPNDAVLFELPGWDACMTWRLDNGRTILQNFVMRNEDCTAERLRYWENYIRRVWGTAGWAECCYDDDCNNEGRFASAPPSSINVGHGDDGGNHYYPQLTPAQDKDDVAEAEDPQPALMNCFLCRQIRNAECQAVRRSTSTLRMLESASDLSSGSLVSSLLANSVRFDFDTMVVKMGSTQKEQQGFCKCKDGYLPVMAGVKSGDAAADPVLTECHDPIVRSAVVGSRCLAEEHCAELPNTQCRIDSKLRAGTGIQSYMTCQCEAGYVLDDDEGRCVLGGSGRPVPCTVDGECAADVENSECVDQEDYDDEGDDGDYDYGSADGANASPDPSLPTGVCRCKVGYLPELNETTLSLSRCRDPIVVTSTVGGMCLDRRHCRFLTGATCRDVPGSDLRTCQCQDGLVEDDPNPVTKLVPRCVLPNGVLPPVIQQQQQQQQPLTDAEAGFDYSEYGEYMEGDEAAAATGIVGDTVVVESQQSTKDKLLGLIAGLPASALEPGSVSEIDPEVIRPFASLLSGLDVGGGGDGSAAALNQVQKRLPAAPVRGAASCQQSMTVVERNEWVPSGRFEMTLDQLTGSRSVVLYAKIPVTATESDGMLLRLMDSSDLGRRMYFVKVLKNREVSIGRSFRNDDDEETDDIRVTASSTTQGWLNRDDYTGYWIAYNSGFISIGVMDENTLDDPLASWRDPNADAGIPDVDTFGLTAVGSAVFYQYMCSGSSVFPEGICSGPADCAHLAHTECRPTAVGEDGVSSRGGAVAADRVLMQSCQCLAGYQMIPRVSRTFAGGCYDPIMTTQTLEGECLDQIHCDALPNTECNVLGRCACLPGYRPAERDPDSGLVRACEPDPNALSSSDGVVDDCAEMFELKPGSSWIPDTLVRTEYRPAHLSYTARFFIRFPTGDTVVAVKLLGGNKSPNKFYKISISGSGSVSIFENLNRVPDLEAAAGATGGRRHEERLQASATRQSIVNTLKNGSFRGYWLTYQPNFGSVTVGEIGDRDPIVQWTDASSSRLADADYVGIEVETGDPTEIGMSCPAANVAQ